MAISTDVCEQTLAMLFIHVVNRTVPKGHRNIDLWFVATEELTARARFVHETPAITFGKANIILAQHFFSSVMCLPTVFRDIGNPSVERRNRVVLNRFPTHLDHIDRESAVDPVCPVRRDYADMLSMIAMRGLLLHELSHVLLGHLPVRQEASLTSLGIQAMEWSADAHGARLLAKTYVDKSAKGMDALFRSLAILHAAADEQTWNPGWTDRRHPLPHDRILTVARGISTVAAERNINWEPRPSDVCDVVDAYERMAGEICNRDYFADSMKDPRKAELLEYWQREIRPLAEPHALVPLPTTGPSPDDLYR